MKDLYLNPLWEPWMNSWIFIEDGVYVAYAPDNSVICRQIVGDETAFLETFDKVSKAWMKEEESVQ